MVDLNKKKKVGFNKPLGWNEVLQVGGTEYSVKALREQAMADMCSEESAVESGCKVNAIDLYVKPEDGKCYYVAHTTRGDVEGSISLEQ